jgi:hypothetical protein
MANCFQVCFKSACNFNSRRFTLAENTAGTAVKATANDKAVADALTASLAAAAEAAAVDAVETAAASAVTIAKAAARADASLCSLVVWCRLTVSNSRWTRLEVSA